MHVEYCDYVQYFVYCYIEEQYNKPYSLSL